MVVLDNLFHAALIHVLEHDVDPAIELVYAFTLDHLLAVQVLRDASLLNRFLVHIVSVILHCFHGERFVIALACHQVDIAPGPVAHFFALGVLYERIGALDLDALLDQAQDL